MASSIEDFTISIVAILSYYALTITSVDHRCHGVIKCLGAIDVVMTDENCLQQARK